MVSGSLHVGGEESAAVTLANALVGEKREVYFASADGVLRDGLDRGVRYLQTDDPAQAPSRVTHELMLYIKHHGFDVIHSHGATCALAASFAARAAKTQPVRVLTHQRRVFRRAPRWISAPVMRRVADHYIAVSDDKQTELRTLGIAPEKISLIPNFVDVNEVAVRVASMERAAVLRSLGIPEGAHVLLTAGRVVAARRFDNFVRIVAEVARRVSDREVHGLILGDGPALDDLKRVAARESSPARIHFPALQRDTVGYLAASDVVVIPFDHPESLPMFLIESSAAGRPVVCADGPRNRELVVDGETGRAVRGGIGDFAAATVELLQHPEAGAVFAHAAQQRALVRFDSHPVAREIVDVYRSVLAARGA